MKGHGSCLVTRAGTLAAAAALALFACSDTTGTPSDPNNPGDPGSPDGGGQPVIAGLHATQADGRYFPATAPWYKDISSAPLASDSSAITQWMVQHAPPNGWGTGRMRVDFSIAAINVPAGTQKRPYQIVTGSYYMPDCDRASVPLPEGGLVEDDPPPPRTSPLSGYACSGFGSGADCHILLVARGERRLYEMYRATVEGGTTFRAGCLAIWDLGMTDVNGRGQQCTSADAAGFPIAALLFTADEIKAGRIDHAIRFILPNDMIRAKKYVMPATHGTNTTGPLTSGPYGFRMRLKASYPIATLSPAAQVVARALQQYGMLMSDGGNIALTAQSDALSSTKWADVGFNADSLAALKATDFEVVDAGTPIDVTYDCKRQAIIEP